MKNSFNLKQTFIKLYASVFTFLKLKQTETKAIQIYPNPNKIAGKSFYYKDQEYIHYSGLEDEQTAFKQVTSMQKIVIIMFVLDLILGFIINWHAALVIIVTLLTIAYFSDLLFNLYLIIRSFSKPVEINISKKKLKMINNRKLPVYTIMCPLYKEWQVIPQFVTAMSKIKYPKNKLQIMLLLEKDDTETIEQVNKYILPEYFDVVIVPNTKPKTKPKAMNYGLQFVRGEYVVIYDAEDIPDPLQLKKAVVAFWESAHKLACIQAKLNFYNPEQNLLTKLFTAEYSLWFDLVLTGLQSIKAPIPLGGTSNHFPTKTLKELKGWDSFNVTEDCDLGMRLARMGFRTAILNSYTLEEANSSISNWFNQRSRWIKGYIQTYLVHMRNPDVFFKGKKSQFIPFQLIVGGKVLSTYINPLMWIITISYFVFRSQIGEFIESFYLAPVFYMGIISLVFGNFLYMYYYIIGCKKHGHHKLTKYTLLIPFYWLIMSAAAWIALYRFIKTPHHWSKTKHGLHLKNVEVETVISTNPNIANNLIMNNKIPIKENYENI